MTTIICPTCSANNKTSRVVSLLPVSNIINQTIYWDTDGTQKLTAPETLYVLFICSNKHVWYDTKPGDL